MQYDIIVFGSATQDTFLKLRSPLIIQNDAFPEKRGLAFGLGSKIEVPEIVLASGGGGTNTAVTFARQGLNTAFIGVVGHDANGRDILDVLRKEGVDPKYVLTHDDGMTAYSVVLVNEDGERTILSYKGEGQHFTTVGIPYDRLQSTWAFVSSLGGSWEVLETTTLWARDNKIQLAINPGGKELAHGLEKLKPLLKHFSVVIMNQEEAADFLGIPYQNEKDIFETMDRLIDGIFVLTKGPNGVSVSDGKKVYTASVPASPVVERTGAGDAFSSGFVCEYARSGDIAKAIQFGTANASSVVTEFGAKKGILTKGNWGPWPLVPVKVSSL
ncbi:MAG: carbohydrate kinase family protein [Patescibacteria group bacterium]